MCGGVRQLQQRQDASKENVTQLKEAWQPPKYSIKIKFFIENFKKAHKLVTPVYKPRSSKCEEKVAAYITAITVYVQYISNNINLGGENPKTIRIKKLWRSSERKHQPGGCVSAVFILSFLACNLPW